MAKQFFYDFDQNADTSALKIWNVSNGSYDTFHSYNGTTISFEALGGNETFTKSEFKQYVAALTLWHSFSKNVFTLSLANTTANVGTVTKTATTIVASHTVGASTILDATYTDSTGNVIVQSHLLFNLSIANFREVLNTMQEMVEANATF